MTHFPEDAPPAPAGTRFAACPLCLGGGKLMDFRAGDRATGEPPGWRAVPCPECAGTGEVPAAEAAAIEGRLREKMREARQTPGTSGT